MPMKYYIFILVMAYSCKEKDSIIPEKKLKKIRKREKVVLNQQI